MGATPMNAPALKHPRGSRTKEEQCGETPQFASEPRELAILHRETSELDWKRCWLLLSLGVFLLYGVGVHAAMPSSTENSITDLRVFADSPNPREVTLSMQYRYDGASGPIARLRPVLVTRGENETADWFENKEVTVTQGQRQVSIRVRFRGGKRGIPDKAITDVVKMQMLAPRGRVVLAAATFPQIITWSGVEPGTRSGAVSDESTVVGSSEETRASENKPERTGFFRKILRVPWPFKRTKAAVAESTTEPGVTESTAAASNGSVEQVALISTPTDTAVDRANGDAAIATVNPSAPEASSTQQADPEPKSESSNDQANEKSDPSELVHDGKDALTSPPESTASADLKTKALAAVERTEDFNFTPTALFANVAADKPENGSFGVTVPERLPGWQEKLTLGAGDILNISLFGAPEVSKTDVFIGPDGRLSFLEAQNVMASGLTIDELRGKLDEELSKFRRSPRTMISPVSFRSKKYYLLGKVAKPGVFTLEQPLTVIQAVARAGGLETGLTGANFVELADLSRSFLVRQGKPLPINFEKLFLEGDLSQNAALEPDDYVYFAAGDLREVYVLGEVNSPGPVAFTPGLGAIGAISTSRGFSDRAWQRRILVVRGSLTHPETFVINAASILSAKSADFRLRPKDIIYVNHRPWIRAEELLDAAATSFVQAAVVMWTGIHVTPIGR